MNQKPLWLPRFLWILLFLIVAMPIGNGCNPGQPPQEMVEEGEKRVRAFVAAVEADNWEDAKKLYADAEKHKDSFRGTILKLDATFNQGSTLKFVLRYKLLLADGREKFVDFVFEKEGETKLKEGIERIRAW